MRTPAFFLLLLISILWESGAVYGRGSLSTWPHANNPDQAAQAEACTLDVVLITFPNKTTDTAGENCLYCNHDRPYGDNPGESSAERGTASSQSITITLFYLKEVERCVTY